MTRWHVVVLVALGSLALAGCPKMGTGTGGGGSPGGGGGGASASGSLTVSASVSFPDPPANVAVVVDGTLEVGHPPLAACAKGDVSSELAIVSDFRDSCHEMIICGGLVNSFSGAAVMCLINAALGRKTGVDNLTYKGNGMYQAGDVMTMTLHLGADTSFGKSGDIIPFDVLDLGTYFKSARISASASFSLGGRGATSYQIDFTEPGPGVELLGLGANPPHPLPKVDFQAMATAFGNTVHAAQSITVHDEKGASRIDYSLSAPPQPLGALFGHAPLPMQLVNVAATRGAQTITVTNWAMQYQPGSSGTLDGSITFEVRGGAFPYRAVFNYPHRKEPDITLSCL
ncbi:MAG: hypothetical protein IT370_30430 [Deltaproteobacteria bacterium]|nr:hypothetical protein [Deltaproteobacteria bacterium]